MRITAALVICVMSLVVTSTAAVAQEGGYKVAQQKPKHNGAWFAFGFGGGVSDAAGSLFGDGVRGGSGYFRVGGTVNQHVLFGGEVLTWWSEAEPGRDLQRVNVTATTMLYPSNNGGLFFKGGFGFAGSEGAGGDADGIGTTFGTGFDFRLGGNFYVTPTLDLLVQFLENSTNSALLFTLGFTWH